MESFETRKKQHIDQALSQAHQALGLSGFDSVRLKHEAIPDLNFQDVLLSSTCLGKDSPTPFYVSGMTAGHADAPRVNRVIAEVSQQRAWAMGVGSQRRDLENPNEQGLVDEWTTFRKIFPRLMLFGNIGMTQVIHAEISSIKKLVDLLEAQALVVHTNPLQEALQPEGTPQFKGSLIALEKLCRELGCPVVLKETGCGMSEATLKRVAQIGLAAVDVSGLGGTHWGRIEGARAESGSLSSLAAETFAQWGISTVESVRQAQSALSDVSSPTEIWGSGGVRSGLDAAKLIALGASQVGYAQPVLKAALKGPELLNEWMKLQEYELRVALFCTGVASAKDLRGRRDLWIQN